jgi:hypothetical protein
MSYINSIDTEGIQAGLAAAPPAATVDLWPSLDPTRPFTLQTTGVNNFLAVTNQIGANFNIGLTNSFGADLTFGGSSAFGLDGCFAGVIDAEPFKKTFENITSFNAGKGDLRGSWDLNGVFISVGPHTGSDIRLKKNVVPLTAEDCLTKVLKFRPVEFDWIDAYLAKNRNQHEVGLIAQEVREVLPEVVIESANPVEIMGEDGLPLTPEGEQYLEIDYGKIAPILIGAIQQQQSQIEDLKKTVQELSTKLAQCCP